jgi:hypothetical protein
LSVEINENIFTFVKKVRTLSKLITSAYLAYKRINTNMKKIFTIISIGILAFTSKAQSNLEVHVGIGTGSYQENSIKTANHALYNAVMPRSENITQTYATAGPIRLGVRSHENKHFILGAEFNYSNIEVINKNGSSDVVRVNFVNYTLMASTQYKYIDKPKFTLYSGLDFGVSLATAKNSETNIKANDLAAAYQANLMGFRYGNEVGFFAELGFGYNGFLSGGLFYRLD